MITARLANPEFPKTTFLPTSSRIVVSERISNDNALGQ